MNGGINRYIRDEDGLKKIGPRRYIRPIQSKLLFKICLFDISQSLGVLVRTGSDSQNIDTAGNGLP